VEHLGIVAVSAEGAALWHRAPANVWVSAKRPGGAGAAVPLCLSSARCTGTPAAAERRGRASRTR